MRIVPEFDVPGHTLAMLKAYPEYASGLVEGRDYFSAMGSALNPARPETFTFLDRLFGEMAALFPDRYFHVGGDEISGADWKANAQVQEFMKANGLKTLHELESYFFDRVRKGVVTHGKTVVGWEEVARTAIPDDVLVQTWRSSSAVARVTAQGNRVIATCGFYVDKLWPAEDHYRIDPHDPAACGLTREQFAEGKAKGRPEAILAHDQVIDPSLTLSAAQQALVLGGEAALWTELVSEEMLDGRLWPGAAVIAERLWSPASSATRRRCIGGSSSSTTGYGSRDLWTMPIAGGWSRGWRRASQSQWRCCSISSRRCATMLTTARASLSCRERSRHPRS